MTIDPDNFLPAADELPLTNIHDARLRLQAVMADWYPELDTSPNTPFGDLMMTPDAVLLAQIEEGLRRLLSDMDLNNVERGIINDPEFVQAYLVNRGLGVNQAVSASGVLRFRFSANRNYVIDAGSVFSFGSSEFRLNASEGSPIVISAAGTNGATRPLTRIADSEYVVYLPVTGVAGATVADGNLATHTLTHVELIDVTAAGDFDPGSPVETLPEMARRARRTFVSATLTSRTGAVSFALNQWPGLMGVSAVLTGDREMLRSGPNPLGIATGALDLYVRSRIRYAQAESTLPLTYDQTRHAWVGALNLPVVPAFFDLSRGVFQVDNFNNARGVSQVYSRSLDTWTDNLGVAYSKQEQLGIAIADDSPSSVTAASTSNVTNLVSDGTTLQVSGEYQGSIFNSSPQRNVTIRLDSLVMSGTTTLLRANARDSVSGEVATVYFAPSSDTNPKTGVLVQTGTGYLSMFNGLGIDIVPNSSIYSPASLLGMSFQFSFQGKTAAFTATYLYDPMLTQVDSVCQSPDQKPVGLSLLVKSCPVCYVDVFSVNYRLLSGGSVDLVGARNAIFSYVNSRCYPDFYNDLEIGQIMSQYGASGLLSVVKHGVFYPSLANIYVQADGTEVTAARIPSTTLQPPVSDQGIGERNVTYLLDANTIEFHGSNT